MRRPSTGSDNTARGPRAEEDGGDQREEHTMVDIEADQGSLPEEASADQSIAGIRRRDSDDRLEPNGAKPSRATFFSDVVVEIHCSHIVPWNPVLRGQAH